MTGPILFSRRAVAVAGLVLPFVGSALLAQSIRRFRPEDFGARGDGRTNDTLAFAAMSSAVEAAGGGTIILARKTYVVGLQRPGRKGEYLLEPAPVIALRNLRHGVTIDGGNALLRAAPGASFGSFDRRNGRRMAPAMPFYEREAIATPYREMILVEDSGGPVTIADLELDGNISRMVLGGDWGDVGRQLPMSGIVLRNNRGPEHVANVHSHDHGLDGLMIDGVDADTGSVRRIERFRSENNGRQGCSIVGGRGYEFVDCDFARTGRATVASPPTAGVDIEAEGGKSVRDLRFARCRFSDNGGSGLIADNGPSRGAAFEDCTFVGTTNWACWPNRPGLVFSRCKFVGATVNPFASPTAAEAAEAAQFRDCLFSDDPASSPTGRVYLSRRNGPIFDAGGMLDGGRNVHFLRCEMALVGEATLPWTVSAIYEDCRMVQRTGEVGYPRGIYRGTNRIDGRVDLYSSQVQGPLYIGGRKVG